MERGATAARPALALLLLFSTGCAARTAGPYLLHAPEPIVERFAGGEIVVRWDEAPAHAPVRIYAGTSPDAIDRERPVAEMTEASAPVPGLPPGTRYFFELAPRDGERRVIGERLLPLRGAHNFRDLGGYRTTDGRTVRWGMIYRSDDLGDLTRADLDYLSELGIRLVCDFRSIEERTRRPDRLPGGDPPEVVNLEIADERFDPGRMGEMIRTRHLVGVDFADLLIKGNRAFATHFTSQYAAMFERLSNPDNLPALIHCTRGKDRTGFAAAMLLLALGVPRETVFEDYLLTNVYTASQIERTLMLIRAYLFFRAEPEAIRPLLGVRRDYLQAAFDAIEEDYGSVEQYLREALGVTDEKREKLRQVLLR